MKPASAKFFLFLSLLIFFLAFNLTFNIFNTAEASIKDSVSDLGVKLGIRREPTEPENVPQAYSVDIRQVGGSFIMVELRGKNMPLPQASNNGNMTVIELSGVSSDKVPAYEEGGLPLVTGVRFENTDTKFTVSIMTERPLQHTGVRGTPPSDVYTLLFNTAEEAKKASEERTATAHPQTLRAPTGPFASEEPITLDLRDTELRDVFRMFGEQINKNIIIHDSMPSILVTMTFKKTPMNRVFGYLMKTYELAYESIDQDTIIVGTEAGLSKISGNEETRAYRIAYADPAAIEGLLPRLTQAEPDNIVVDARLRTLYVTGSPQVLEEVSIAIQKLDHPGKQVMLQARILEFTKRDEVEVAKALNAVYDHWAFSYANGALTGLFADDNRVGRTITTTEGSRIIPPALGTTITAPIEGIWREFDASFRALETKNRSKVLANPSVITIDGQEASINLTEEYPYISGRDDAQNSEWSRLTVGPQLSMTPIVGRDGTVTLTLSLTTSEVIATIVGSTGEEMPQVSERNVETTVRVRNGEPFVVGGLFREDNVNNVLKIPILGNLPLIGELFTMRTRNATNTQVVMIVIPFILDTPDVAVEYERLMMRQ